MARDARLLCMCMRTHILWRTYSMEDTFYGT